MLRQSGKTYYYNHSYFGDGREKTITAFGDAHGGSVSTYDANKIRSSVNLGQGDGQDRPEIKTFVADNEGHLLFQFHDDGKSGTNEMREYAYANGNPVVGRKNPIRSKKRAQRELLYSKPQAPAELERASQARRDAAEAGSMGRCGKGVRRSVVGIGQTTSDQLSYAARL